MPEIQTVKADMLANVTLVTFSSLPLDLDVSAYTYSMRIRNDNFISRS